MYFICRRQKIYKKVFVKGIVIIMYEIILGVEGMRCGMCEAHVNDAIRNNFKVKKVESSHDKSRTVILSEEEIAQDQLKSVIGEIGYNVTSFSVKPYEKKGHFSFGKH